MAKGTIGEMRAVKQGQAARPAQLHKAAQAALAVRAERAVLTEAEAPAVPQAPADPEGAAVLAARESAVRVARAVQPIAESNYLPLPLAGRLAACPRGTR